MKKLIVLLFALLTIGSVFASQPTQQFNKIFLRPFYVESMTNGQNYNFNVTVTPPDKISSVVNAMVSFQIYIVPTVSFNLTVNGKACTPPVFLVHTTYMDAGYAVVSFDCSNVINKEGVYNLTLRPVSANTGAVYGWLDLTYMNNPKGSMSIMGTEYKAGDQATVFLQLTDSYGNVVNNGSCYLDIWYPKNITNVHPLTVTSAPMLQAPGNKGVYYYDLVVPEYLGVYMVSANCGYTYNWQWIYPEDENVYYPNRQVITGTYIGSSQVLNSKIDDDYERCDATAAIVCQANYTFNVSQYGTISNITNVNLYYAGQSDIAAKVVTFAYWNGTAFVNLANTLTTVATGATATIPGDTDLFVTNSVPITAVRPNGALTIRITTPTGLARYYNNWLSLAVLTSIGTVQDLKGSNEIHVSEYAKDENKFITIDTCDGYIDGRCGIFTNDAEFNLREGEIEDYINVTATRTQTNAEITYTTPFSVDCSALYWIKYYDGASWVNYTNYEVITQDGNENCIIIITNNITQGTDYKYWLKFDNYMKWEIDYTKQISDSVYNAINASCLPFGYTYTVPITDSTVLSNNSIINFCHYAYDDKYYIDTLYTDANAITTAGEYSSYVHELRFYRTELYDRYMFLSLGNNTNVTGDFYAKKNWEYSNRNLTYYPPATTTVNGSDISSWVWNNTNRQLTNASNVAVDIWNYNARNLTWFPTMITALDIWTYVNRNLTYYPPATAYVNNTEISDYVWNYTARYTHGEII